MKSPEYICWDLLQANYGLIQIMLIVRPNSILESLHRQTARTLLYERTHGLVGRLPHTLITGGGQTGTPFLQSEFSSQSWGQDHGGFTEDTNRERVAERERRKEGERYNYYKQEVKRWGKPLVHRAHMYRNDIRIGKSKSDHRQPQVFDMLWHTDSCWHILAYMHIKLSFISEHADKQLWRFCE